MQTTQRIIARMLIVSLAWAGMPATAVHAALIPTDQVAAGRASPATSRDRVHAFLARADVRAEMERNGVDPQAADARVAALSDAEVDVLAGKLDSLPAGGDFGGIVGAAVFIFLVLLITDLLGLTKVFSFTRPIK
ncbi:MAG: PA2779 family protein [Proteobacteria bacterium]|nr:PA2779 family protein [Pseudomonadota bacterium]